MNFKNNLKLILHERDMTAAQLSRLTKIPKTTIADWLSGGSPRDINKLKTLSEALGLTIDELCFGEGKKKKSVTLEDYKEEIFAGNFDVILRKVKK